MEKQYELRKVCRAWPFLAYLAGLGRGSRDAFGTVEFGFDVGDVAFGEIVEQLPGAVFLLQLGQHGIGESCAAFAVLFCGSDPVAQIGEIAAESGYVGGRAGIAVPGDERNRGVCRKFGERREGLKPRERGGVDQIGQGLPPEKVSAEDDGGLVLLHDHYRIAPGVAGKIFDSNKRGSDAKFDRGIVENVGSSKSLYLGLLLG